MKGRCKLEMLNKSSVWPGTNRNIENLATFVATLPWVALLALLVCIDLVSARVTWVKSQNWDSWKLSFRCFDYVSLCKEFLILVAADQHGCYFATTEIWRRIPFAFMVFCHRADQTIQSDQKQRQPFEFWLNLTNIARAAAIKRLHNPFLWPVSVSFYILHSGWRQQQWIQQQRRQPQQRQQRRRQRRCQVVQCSDVSIWSKGPSCLQSLVEL